MSDQREEGGGKGKEYSVDEILAEFGSGKYGRASKVVDFPPPDKRPKSAPDKVTAKRHDGQNTIRFDPVRRVPEAGEKPEGEKRRAEDGAGAREMAGAKEKRPAQEPDGEIVDISPASPLRRLWAHLSVFSRRTDHYADHMYDQAEPDEEAKKAEKYIPGVDEEEVPEPGRRLKKPRPVRRMPPDVEPAKLTKRCAKGLRGKKIRMALALLCAAACTMFALFDLERLGLAGHVPEDVPQAVVRLGILLGFLVVTALLCAEVTFGGLILLFTLRPGPSTVLSLAFFATVGDGVSLILAGGGQRLPCCAVIALGLVLGLWGDRARRQGDRLSARCAAQTKAPFVVTLDEGKWSGRPAFAKWLGTQDGFGSQLQSEDGVHRAYFVAAPLLIVICLVCAGMSAAAGGRSRFWWTLSATLTAAAAWCAPLIYALPYQRLARRLFDQGAALAGWPGTARCRKAGILVSDNDLFPTGTVQVSGVKVFGSFANEKVVSYTATLLRVLDCGLTQPFRELLHAQGTFYREVSGVRYHEGGVTGIIRDHEVFVGTADFMRLMDVALPRGLSVKHAVFCAINGELAGIFALKYAMGQTVRPCLSALMGAGVSPIVATRDPNLIPGFLGEKFKLPVDRMEFPPVERRLGLSDPRQEHDDTPAALLSREGLGPYCDAVVGGKRLRSAVHTGTVLSLTGSAAGVAVTFYLTYLEAAASLTVPVFLVFMALWSVPAVLLNFWVDRY